MARSIGVGRLAMQSPAIIRAEFWNAIRADEMQGGLSHGRDKGVGVESVTSVTKVG